MGINTGKLREDTRGLREGTGKIRKQQEGYGRIREEMGERREVTAGPTIRSGREDPDQAPEDR